MIRKYRKKPVEIEAIQYTEDNYSEIYAFLGKEDEGFMGEWFKIKTLEGDMIAHVGDYIIKGVKGEFYPCKPDIFELTYEKVNLTL
jgi:hypothetical protein